MEITLGCCPALLKLADLPSKQFIRIFLVAMTAGAALTVAHPALAEIVYTPVNVTISDTGSAAIDLNHAGANFTLGAVATSASCAIIGSAHHASLALKPAKGNGVAAASGNAAALLSSGAQIDSSLDFYDAAAQMATETIQVPPCPTYLFFSGRWCHSSANIHAPCTKIEGYLGLRLSNNGNTYYGWAHVIVTPVGEGFVVNLTGYAYENTPGVPINAGQT